MDQNQPIRQPMPQPMQPQLPPPGNGGNPQFQPQQPRPQPQPQPRRLARPDQEEMVCQRIRSAIRMGIMMRDAQKQSNDSVLLECALDGVVNGTVVEIIRILDLEPSYQSVYRPGSLTAKPQAQ